MALRIELLETSFQAIAPWGEAFVTAFYKEMTADSPRDNMSAQGVPHIPYPAIFLCKK